MQYPLTIPLFLWNCNPKNELYYVNFSVLRPPPRAGDGRQPPPRRPAAPGAPDPNPRASSASPPPVMGNGRSASMPIIASPILEGDVTFADGIGVGLGPEGVQTEGRPPTTSEGGLDDRAYYTCIYLY